MWLVLGLRQAAGLHAHAHACLLAAATNPSVCARRMQKKSEAQMEALALYMGHSLDMQVAAGRALSLLIACSLLRACEP